MYNRFLSLRVPYIFTTVAQMFCSCDSEILAPPLAELVYPSLIPNENIAAGVNGDDILGWVIVWVKTRSK